MLIGLPQKASIFTKVVLFFDCTIQSWIKTIHDVSEVILFFSPLSSSKHVFHQESHLFWGTCEIVLFLGCVLPHFNFLGQPMKYCGWMAVIYATQAATVQSWIALSSHTAEPCWLWGLIFLKKKIDYYSFVTQGFNCTCTGTSPTCFGNKITYISESMLQWISIHHSYMKST